MTKVTIVMMAVSAMALSACATKPDLPGSSLGATFTAERYLEEDHGGSGFNGALAEEYTELGRRAAFTDERWYNATAYMSKIEAAEAGRTPSPWSPEQLGVSAEAEVSQEEVVDIVQANRDARPAACARMQAMYDQYLESLRAQPADCPLPPDEALALFEEARAACLPPSADENYIVYFGFDRSDLTPRARDVLDEVVAAVETLSSTALSIVGHTDTSGPDDYNQRLSERRARSVAQGLVERGVPQGAMTLAGRGEREPARVTGDGVREPLNRRVEITLSN
jgi:outer membrane protein OmpA-like peptidoglycan-associated protein